MITVTRQDQNDINHFSLLSTKYLFFTDYLKEHQENIANLTDSLVQLQDLKKKQKASEITDSASSVAINEDELFEQFLMNDQYEGKTFDQVKQEMIENQTKSNNKNIIDASPSLSTVMVECGSGFLHLPLDRAEKYSKHALLRVQTKRDNVKVQLEQVEREMHTLKDRLYKKFGDSIQLELAKSTS